MKQNVPRILHDPTIQHHNPPNQFQERQTYMWSGCVLKRTKSASTPPIPSFSSREGPQIRPYFLWSASTKTWTGGKGLSCFSQEMWKATQEPCGAVLYVHIKSPHSKPPSNAIIPPLTGFKFSHIKLKSYSPSFKCHTHQIPTPKTTSHIHNLTQKTLHTHQQTKPTTQNQPTSSLTTPNNINIIQLNINSITKKTTAHPPNT